MAVAAVAAGAAAVAALPRAEISAGYGAGIGQITQFAGALAAQAGVSGGVSATVPAAAAGPPADVDVVSPALKGMFAALDRVNGEATAVGDFARAAQAQGRDLSPGEIVQLTMRCHEFMFHCQLSSSIANRTSDGLQQLFRQQS
jgi:hypothetical protein